MKFIVSHITTYRYVKAVLLGPHVIRLHPRIDGNVLLQDYRCDIEPNPCASHTCLDHEGNVVLHARFDQPTHHLKIASWFVANTVINDGCVLSEPSSLPMVYSDDEQLHLAPYRQPLALDVSAQQLLDRIVVACDRKPMPFLECLNTYLYENIQREIRHDGGPQTPSRTLARGRGACRDVSVLFMALCKAQGFATRFVSGYQAKPEVDHGRRFLHAWPEVFIPGFGWQGYDPTHGRMVTDAHVPIAASCTPAGAAPIEGSYYGEAVESQMEFAVNIDVQDS